MEKSRLLEIRNVIEDIKNKGINEERIITLDLLLNENRIPMCISSRVPLPAAFNPSHNVINVNMDRIESWIDKRVELIMEAYEIEDVDLLRAYLVAYMYRHEVEHSNQFYYATGMRKNRYDFMNQVYADLYSVLLSKRYVIPRPVSLLRDIVRFAIYKKNAYSYLLERNATVAGYDLAFLIANESNDKVISESMADVRNISMLIGYIDNGDGALLKTYQGLLMMGKYNKLDIPTDLSLIEKIREGLVLSEEEHKKALGGISSQSKLLKQKKSL